MRLKNASQNRAQPQSIARVLHNNDADDRAFNASTNYQLINSFNILVFGYFSRQIHGALFALIRVERYNIETNCTSGVR